MNTGLPVETAPAPPAGPGPAWLAWVGALVATALAFVSAVWEAFLTPLALHWSSGGHAHSVRVPVALLLAIAGNAALAWFTHSVTGKPLAVLAPFAAWTVPIVLAASKRAEGDAILTANNWVALVTMLAGPVSFAVTAYWLTMRSLRRPA
ncbi:DUF6113 family protein [Planosporangium mesophilum]|uniref:Uncharacterized protein n=1 Tax=Planosporangium mesophilum TaxID=689768 RepID=A0A8J3T9I6_9ACTN|nr:DUF6113 family protein [Planosporangium mesophilum]GII21102.1 hypothetical protein Pme01_06990 [Planosporangium mesophilum]